MKHTQVSRSVGHSWRPVLFGACASGLLLLAGCGGAGSSSSSGGTGSGTGGGGTGSGTGGGGTSGTGGTSSTSVYVIQNPSSATTAGSILRFPTTSSGSVSPSSSITVAVNTGFLGLAVDASSNVYTEYYGPTINSSIVEYAAGVTGAATPIRSIPANTLTGVTAVDSLGVDASGDVLVGEDYGGVQVFTSAQNGSVAPARDILGAYETGGGLSLIGEADAVTSDPSGNIYVAQSGYTAVNAAPVLVFASGANGNAAPFRQIVGAATGMAAGEVAGMTTDSSGNLYVSVNVPGAYYGTGTTFGYTPAILEFAAGASGNATPIRTITGSSTLMAYIGGPQVDASGSVYVCSYNLTTGAVGVLRFAAGANGNVAPVASFTSTAWTSPDQQLSIAVR